MFEVGQSIEVKVLKFDPDSQRVSLGYKQIRPDPWEEAEYKYPVGAIVRGKVVSIPDYGAFVELEDGIEGLVHISEMTWNKRVKHPSKLVNVGDIVEAKVLGMDVENKRISLGMKQLEAEPLGHRRAAVPGRQRSSRARSGTSPTSASSSGSTRASTASCTSATCPGASASAPLRQVQEGRQRRGPRALDRQGQRALLLGIKQLTEDPWYTVQSGTSSVR
jgi:small subunit ribosomal protein S1